MANETPQLHAATWALASALEPENTKAQPDQLVIRESAKGFAETRTALREGIESRGLAAFGNPKVGTILMQADPRARLVLPIRVLLRDTGEGTEVVYRSAQAIGDTFQVAKAADTMAKLLSVLDAVTDEVLA